MLIVLLTSSLNDKSLGLRSAAVLVTPVTMSIANLKNRSLSLSFDILQMIFSNCVRFVNPFEFRNLLNLARKKSSDIG